MEGRDIMLAIIMMTLALRMEMRFITGIIALCMEISLYEKKNMFG